MNVFVFESNFQRYQSIIIDCNTHLPYYWSSLVSQDFCNNGRFNIDIDQRYIFPGIGKDGIQKLRI